MGLTNLQAPTWDNSKEYQGFSDPNLTQDLAKVADLIKKIAEKSAQLSPQLTTAQVSLVTEILAIKWEAVTLNSNVRTFASAALSVDGSLEAAKQIQDQSQLLGAKLGETLQVLENILFTCDQKVFQEVLATSAGQDEKYQLEVKRQFRPFMLSLAEEQFLKRFNLYGPQAWGQLYDNLSSLLKCQHPDPNYKGEPIGLATAINFREHPNAAWREAAYRSVNAAWTTMEEPCTAALNNLVGWRLAEYEKRGMQDDQFYLQTPLMQNSIKKATLDSMLQAITAARPAAQAALQKKAKVLGKKQLAPWDLFAPYPQEKTTEVPFPEALTMVTEAFNQLHPEAGEFVQMMAKERWIEASDGPRKRPGAYCTKFTKSRTPRVYLTYSGSTQTIFTLAHELGHALHNWVMRDLPLGRCSYPMTLAETASVFSEIMLSSYLENKVRDPSALSALGWLHVSEAEAFLLNIPARFRFEQQLYEARRQRSLSTQDLCTMMKEAWHESYGPALSEYDERFWQSKLHFYISGLTFYNFPYSFGFLFSWGLFAEYKKRSKDFYPLYKALLRDTGSMSAEDVVAKHLQADISKPAFWQAAIEQVLLSCQKLA